MNIFAGYMVKVVFATIGILVVINAQIYQRPDVQPEADEADCICKPSDSLCKCTFIVEHRITMMQYEERRGVKTAAGKLVDIETNVELTEEQSSRVITADGEGSRLVIAINNKFPGPRVEVFENKEIEITVVNTFHTDSVTVHFHGIHQKNTPWMDGVAYVTQCPILPGQSFVYRFKAYPPGTSFYHAHIGDQRSMGLYGPFIVRKRDTEPISEIIISLQDWNHDMDAETAYQTMITEQYNGETKIPTTSSLDGGQFSRFAFQSGIVNGKGRFWRTSSLDNSAPLEKFRIESGRLYRFRVIGAMTLYPMRIRIEGTDLSLRTSDCFNIKNIPVQSIIVHPGERYDFHVQFSNPSKKQYMFVAETIETPSSHSSYHAAEAIIEITNVVGNVNLDPDKAPTPQCTSTSKCVVFNCPYAKSGSGDTVCLTYNNVSNSDPYRDPSRISGNHVDEEYFFNFAFPGFPGNTPGSVNGRAFISPTAPLLTQGSNLKTKCNDKTCKESGLCDCTYIVDVLGNKRIQMTFLNIGNGSGWSHPIHLHGQSFFVMKMGFGTYDSYGKLIADNTDINCTDDYGFCIHDKIKWTDSLWEGGNIPDQNSEPPIKDTIIVPTGGYVVVRFYSDNPGMWFLHCHIDLHNTNGMGMVINSGPGNHPKAPTGFPICGNFFDNGEDEFISDGASRPVNVVLIVLFASFVFLYM